MKYWERKKREWNARERNCGSEILGRENAENKKKNGVRETGKVNAGWVICEVKLQKDYNRTMVKHARQKRERERGKFNDWYEYGRENLERIG